MNRLAINWSDGNPTRIDTVRRADPAFAARYQEEIRDRLYVQAADGETVPEIGLGDIIGEANGMLPDGSSIWLIDEDQADEYRRLNAERVESKRQAEADVPAPKGQLIESGEGYVWIERDGTRRYAG